MPSFSDLETSFTVFGRAPRSMARLREEDSWRKMKSKVTSLAKVTEDILYPEVKKQRMRSGPVGSLAVLLPGSNCSRSWCSVMVTGVVAGSRGWSGGRAVMFSRDSGWAP